MGSNGKPKQLADPEQFVKDIRKCNLCGENVTPGKDAGDEPYRHNTCQFQCPVCLKKVNEKDSAPRSRLRHRNCIMSPEATQVIARQMVQQMCTLCQNFNAVTGHEVGGIQLNNNKSITVGIKWEQQRIIIPKGIII